MSGGPANWYPSPEVMATFPKPNYINPESQRGLMLGFMVPLIMLTLVVVTLRMHSRAMITRYVGVDDWLMLFAVALGVALMVVEAVSTEYGWGKHIWDFERQWLVPARKLAFVTELLFVWTTAITKFSILAFYLRVFQERRFRILCHAGNLFVGLLLLSCTLAVLLQCRPLRAYWDANTPGVCFDNLAALTSSGVLNSLADIYVFLLPINQVWAIQLPAKQRMGLIAIFGLGIVSLLASFVRIYYIKVTYHDSYDFTWVGAPLYIATAIECDIAIFCGSIPALKPLIVQIFPKFRGSQASVLKSLTVANDAYASRHQHGDSVEGLVELNEQGITRKVEVEVRYSATRR